MPEVPFSQQNYQPFVQSTVDQFIGSDEGAEVDVDDWSKVIVTTDTHTYSLYVRDLQQREDT